MGERRTICVATSGRADYGLLLWPMRAIAAEEGLELLLLVTGAHLETRFGLTVREIEADGFRIDARLPMGLVDDDPQTLAAASGRLLETASAAFGQLRPDMLLVLGDRYETLALAQAALLCGLPVAHLCGGELTEGAFDESLRHAVTKLSHLHLVTHAAAAARVRQLGEAPDRVRIVGNPGLDRLRRDPPMSTAALEERLGARLGGADLLVTFHPVTLAADKGRADLEAMLQALSALPSSIRIWVTRANADPGGMAINQTVEQWAAGRSGVSIHDALGAAYLPLMRRCAAVVGNSSSGLLEAPSLNVPTVNVGVRQKGRAAGPSVIHVPGEAALIGAALARAMAGDVPGFDNPYGDGRSSERIVEALLTAPPREHLLTKAFCDLEVQR